MDLRVPGGEYLTTSDQFLELGELPARIVFVEGASSRSSLLTSRQGQVLKSLCSTAALGRSRSSIPTWCSFW